MAATGPHHRDAARTLRLRMTLPLISAAISGAVRAVVSWLLSHG